MRAAPLPPNEKERLARLDGFKILDTLPEETFDRITRIVANTIGVPVALVSLVDANRQWFKSRHGLNTVQTPRELAFCAHAILRDELFVVEDALEDERFCDNPLVVEQPLVRFYAGAPLITSDGYRLGTLCAIDHEPRQLDELQSALLEDLATVVIDEMELRNAYREISVYAREQEKLKTKAESSERAKSQFLASMSHEIRTPLNAIIGLTDLVLKSELTDRQRGYLNNVALAGNNLLGIINDVLDSAKIEAGEMEIHNVDFSVAEVFANVCSVISHKADENGNELAVEIDPGVPAMLHGDPMRLGQVLINLGGNAVKFTEHGEILIAAHYEPSPDGGVLAVSVRDTGIGMSEDNIKDLFQRFKQVDQSLARAHGGTGLGLSISKQLVELMGGAIQMHSSLGKGSEFTIKIPMTAAKLPTLHAHPAPKIEGAKILVIDDNGMVRDVLRRSLRALGAEVETVSSPSDGVRAVSDRTAAGGPFDLILLDGKISDGGCADAYRTLKSLDATADLPIAVMLSEFDIGRMSDTLAALGDVPTFSKPIITTALPARIQKVRGVQAAAAAGAPAPQDQLKSAVSGLRLLLAEDNDLNQMVAEGVLKSAGFDVDIVSNGAEAVARLKAVGPDHFAAVLMDIQMPIMDGISAAKLIRGDLGFKRLPIIAMTAHALQQDRELSLLAGMNDHVTKPVNARELIGTVNSWAKDWSPKNTGPALPPSGVLVFDLAVAADRLQLPSELLASIAAKFVQQYSAAEAELSNLMNGGDWEAAADYVHSIKGVSGNLSAEWMYEASAELESRLRGEEPQIEPFVAQFQSALQATLAAMADAPS